MAINGIKTGKNASSSTGKLLGNNKSTKIEKEVGGSALSNARRTTNQK